MTLLEFSDEFDILYNNIASNQAPGLDEYEKSVFLTRALNEIVLAYFSINRNRVLEGFEMTAKREVDFSKLITTATITSFTNNDSPLYVGLGSKLMKIPDITKALAIVNETALVTRGGSNILLLVKPLNFMQYNLLINKPYARPTKRTAWRMLIDNKIPVTPSSAPHMSTSDVGEFTGEKVGNLDNNPNIGEFPGAGDLGDDHEAELMPHCTYALLIAAPNDTFVSYTIRYVKKPSPIILPGVELSIDGETAGNINKGKECTLDPILHQDILYRAVELAKMAMLGYVVGSTDLGLVAPTSSNKEES